MRVSSYCGGPVRVGSYWRASEGELLLEVEATRGWAPIGGQCLPRGWALTGGPALIRKQQISLSKN